LEPYLNRLRGRRNEPIHSIFNSIPDTYREGNSSIAIIDDTTIEVNGNLTFLKKTEEISMNFRDFID